MPRLVRLALLSRAEAPMRQPSRSAALRAACLAAGGMAFLFVGFFGTGLAAFDPGIRLTAQILFGVPLVVWASIRLRGPSEILDWAILGGLLLALVVSLFSLDMTGSLEAFGLSVAFAVLFFLMREASTRPGLRAAVAVGISAAITLWLLVAASTWLGQKLEWISAGGGIPDLESGPIPGWSSANTLPILSLVGLPFLMEIPWRLARRILSPLYVGASLVVIPLSLGRAAYLGILGALVAYELLRGAPILRGAARMLRERHLVAVAASAGILIVAAAAGVEAARGWGLVLAVMTSRWRLWEQAASIFADRPLMGAGPSTFQWLRLENAPDYGDRITVYLAHDVVMQTLADGGLLLLSALALVLGAYAFSLRRQSAPLNLRQRVGLAVLIGFSAVSLLDDMSTFNAVTAMVVTLAAWVLGPRNSAGGGARPLALPIAIALLAAVSLPAVVSIDVARINAAMARQAALAGNWSAATERFRIAIAAHPVDAGYRLGLGLALTRIGDATGAMGAYAAAASLAPGDPRPFAALATLSHDNGERTRLLDFAARRTIRDPQYAYRLGEALTATGDAKRAMDAYALAVAIDSRLFGVLPDSIDRSAVAAAVRRTVEAFRDQADIIGLWVDDDVDLSLRRLSRVAPPAWQAVAAVRNGALAEAGRFALAALGADPHAANSYQSGAYVAAAECDPIRVAQLRHLLRLIPLASIPHAGRVAEAWDDAYREEGLGDYQPIDPATLPSLPEWPLPLVPPPGACD